MHNNVIAVISNLKLSDVTLSRMSSLISSVRLLPHLYKIIPQRCVSSAKTPPEHKIVMTDDGSTLVAWHPQQDFPYECTKPLPEERQQVTSSVLNVELTPQLLEIFNKKTPEQARQELMNITFTTKHRWFPKARLKRHKKTPMDREYL